jgi:hypothetical protein
VTVDAWQAFPAVAEAPVMAKPEKHILVANLLRLPGVTVR